MAGGVVVGVGADCKGADSGMVWTPKGREEALALVGVINGCGGGLGAFGAARLGTHPDAGADGAEVGVDDEGAEDEVGGAGGGGLARGACRGMGGGARGFSKLPSWFCGNLGDVIPGLVVRGVTCSW